MLKLLTGMCNDHCPLNFRDKTARDHVTPDPYFEVAPDWSTVSGGRKPYIRHRAAGGDRAEDPPRRGLRPAHPLGQAVRRRRVG